MKILLISDIHANIEALTAIDSIERPFDHIFCMGDLVDYGPSPRECVEWLRDHKAEIVRGNHDDAVGAHAPCGCIPPYLRLSEDTRRLMWQLLTEQEQQWLAELPRTFRRTIAECRFFLCHAAPNAITLYLPPQTPAEHWANLFGQINADLILLGHTHLQMDQVMGSQHFLNPGSVGQPKPRGQMAQYAIWKDGEIHLKDVSYDYTTTQDKIRALPLTKIVQDALCWILEHGNPDGFPDKALL
jgi:putative phosphoesterase